MKAIMREVVIPVAIVLLFLAAMGLGAWLAGPS